MSRIALLPQQMNHMNTQMDMAINKHLDVAGQLFVKFLTMEEAANKPSVEHAANLAADAASVFMQRFGVGIQLKAPPLGDNSGSEPESKGYAKQ